MFRVRRGNEPEGVVTEHAKTDATSARRRTAITRIGKLSRHSTMAKGNHCKESHVVE